MYFSTCVLKYTGSMKFNGQLTGPFPILDRVSHSAVLAGLELCVDRLCLLSMGVRGVHHTHCTSHWLLLASDRSQG